MQAKKTLMLALLPAGFLAAQSSSAFDVVEAGQPVVTGEPSRVGAPWNHRSTFNIPGTNTDVAFGGYVKFDALYDFDYDLGEITDPLAAASEANATDGKTTFTAQETRLNFRTQTRFGDEMLKTYFEGHFAPDNKFNLRHAYGEYNGFLAGQTWTNAMFFLGTPRILKLGGPIGYATGRPEQVRYTYQSGANTFAVALENPESSISDLGPGGAADENTELPDLTMRYRYKRNFGISGVVRRFSTDSAVSGQDESATGYGVIAQAALPMGSTTLKGNMMVGSGLGGYLDYVPASGAKFRAPDAYLDADGNLETVDLQSFGVSLDHHWNDAWMSSIGTSVVSQDLPDDAPAFQGMTDTVQFSHVNLIWDVNSRMTVGLEYQYVDLEKISGDEVDASRLQASAQFHF
ncbi:DcaP family trimeric outer membrane transporter [Halomonas organivorans]|uniref:Opacity protein-like surface antigen n=1 Tax=Halomonas organivorans TaxID=257772 RepID=A0A7W5G5Q8_9GAMM|nr:DcaP family trimeric outer membrane transporter [Halomonas organivorans]MBB3141379.1 opacity protein-like surface antigen [Halomonas organivorans]